MRTWKGEQTFAAPRGGTSGAGDLAVTHPKSPTPSAPSMAWAGPFHCGQVVAGMYEIHGMLGAGGMGVVYDARDLPLDRNVAIKVALAEAGPLLHQEARALAAVHHPNLVTVHALARHEGVEFIVMERLTGVTLEDRIIDLTRAGELMPLDEVIDVMVAITEGLTAVHHAGIAHRDVKTANVMVSAGRVVLTDFGLVTPECDVADASRIAGSVDYMAPELIRGAVRPGSGPLVDLYALGVVGVARRTGARPDTHPAPRRVLGAHLPPPVPDVHGLRREVPAELSRLVGELMAKSPHERPESAEVVLWRLAALRAHRSLASMRVLVVDDEPRVAALVRRSLEASLPGLSVRATSSPEQALSACEREPPDVVLVDLEMPGMNGLELCMLLNALPEGGRPMLVVMSAEAGADDLAMLRSIGVGTFVLKDRRFVSRVCRVIGELRRELSGVATRSAHPRPLAHAS